MLNKLDIIDEKLSVRFVQIRSFEFETLDVSVRIRENFCVDYKILYCGSAEESDRARRISENKRNKINKEPDDVSAL